MPTAKKKRPYGTGSVYQRGDGRWIGALPVGYTQTGTTRYVRVSDHTEAGAHRKLDVKVKDVIRNGPPPPSSTRLTVKAWSEQWLTDLKRTARPKYYATDASAVSRWIVPTIGKRRLDHLNPGDVRAVANAVRAAKRSTTTERYVTGVLRRMLTAAQAEGHPIAAPVLTVKAAKKAASTRTAIPTDDAIKLLRAATDTPAGSRWVAALLQGMRQGECLGLTWDAIDLDAGTLDISWQLQALPYADRRAKTFRIPDGEETRHPVDAFHLTRPKTASGRRLIPLVPGMTDMLRRHRDESEANPWALVWPELRRTRTGAVATRPATSPADRAAWYALQRSAGVAKDGEPYLLHEARHTTATLLLELGVDHQVIVAIMGHSSIEVTRGYQHASTALARRALEQVAARLGITNATDPLRLSEPAVP